MRTNAEKVCQRSLRKGNGMIELGEELCKQIGVHPLTKMSISASRKTILSYPVSRHACSFVNAAPDASPRSGRPFDEGRR